MGCFSFLCKESGKPALSTSFDGSPCHLFLLKDGECLEHMFGNYDSYGRVFKEKKEGSFEWKMSWGDVVDLMYNGKEGDGIAMILPEHYKGGAPTTQSEGDPNQGWGSDDLELMGDTSPDSFREVSMPFHTVLKKITLPEKDQTVVLLNGHASDVENIKEVAILANGEALYRISIHEDGKITIKTPTGKIKFTDSTDNNSITITSK